MCIVMEVIKYEKVVATLVFERIREDRVPTLSYWTKDESDKQA
jgi:hypothetical protein